MEKLSCICLKEFAKSCRRKNWVCVWGGPNRLFSPETHAGYSLWASDVFIVKGQSYKEQKVSQREECNIWIFSEYSGIWERSICKFLKRHPLSIFQHEKKWKLYLSFLLNSPFSWPKTKHFPPSRLDKPGFHQYCREWQKAIQSQSRNQT